MANNGHDPRQDPDDGGAADERGGEHPVFRDNRRIDPVTGEVRDPGSSQEPAGSGSGAPGAADPAASATSSPTGQPAEEDVVAEAESILAQDDAGTGEATASTGDADRLAAERLADLQRLQAEFVNYRRRVERDRDVARTNAVISVMTSLLPVLDDLDAARQHGDLTDGPFASIASKLDAILQQQGLERYGEVGTAFDPTIHEALLQQPSDEVESGHISHVLRAGYRVGERVLRAAQVGVAA